MVEILWNSDAPHSPAENHEMVELRLVDTGSAEKPSFLVREVHAAWSAAAQQIEWKGFEDERFASAQAAERWFASRAMVNRAAGYGYRTLLD